MANQVVIPFPGSRFQTAEPVLSSRDWRSASPRSLHSRLVTARKVVRAVIETLSYLAEARVHPPARPALPAARSTK
jgi:hypothetical protein